MRDRQRTPTAAPNEHAISSSTHGEPPRSPISGHGVGLNSAGRTCDFTSGQEKAYGTEPMKDLGDGRFGMVGGDAAQVFGIVNSADRTAVWNERNQVGYRVADVKLSGVVDSAARTVVWNNRNRSSQVP